ncbi:endonuclease/exonuclease/phosphatase family protein [Nocardioides speluncae]|uniref:endonuclease/exonuclease/phosphatase family protein n=1 Tax=Nocardioides speluncae TaxID=2670337 RepID=UPI000D695880|nr:endonuclease/exonuclease/phosphatase family protein [Nocardioides speluncae]
MLWKPIGDVICWQECINAEVRADLARTLPYHHVTFNDDDFGPGMNSISYRPDLFRLVAFDSEKASEARAGVSPARFVCWVILEHIATGVRFAVVNVHFISGAFRIPPPLNVVWRLAQWFNNRRVLRRVVGDLRARGLPVLVGGDPNRKRWDILGAGLVEPRYTDAGPTVDRIAVSADVTVESARLGPKNGSDHFAVIARLHLPEEN